MTASWRDLLPQLAISADDDVCQLFDNSSVIALKQRSTVFHQGDACKNYLIVLDGKIRVFTRAENGREILLYRLLPGDSCVLTTSCLFANKNYPAEGVTETDTVALSIPYRQFNDALQLSVTFRELVFSAFSSHLSELIELIEEVAFGKIDIRLARLLLNQRDANNTITSTHQNIATELGSAREVISRQLKELEAKGFIMIYRGRIEVRDIAALQQISAS